VAWLVLFVFLVLTSNDQTAISMVCLFVFFFLWFRDSGEYY
jgi:hypothetical protein